MTGLTGPRHGAVRSWSGALGVGVALVASLVVACSSSPSVPTPDGAIPLGTWGADNAGMIVGDTAMHLHVGCTFGDVSGRVPVDGSGRFDAQGTYMLHAYPITVGPPVPARFTGTVSGGKATVTVTVNDTTEGKTVVLGPVVVTYGVEPRMGPCPICRRPIHTLHSSAPVRRRTPTRVALGRHIAAVSAADTSIE